MDTYFDEIAMRNLLRKKRLSLTGWANYLSVSKPTLYRKMSGESDFWRNEIFLTCKYVGEIELNYIFFANKVT